MATILLKVTGMKCGGCETQVQEAAKALAGVSSAHASYRTGSVEIEYDNGKTNVDAIKRAIQGKGYAVA